MTPRELVEWYDDGLSIERSVLDGLDSIEAVRGVGFLVASSAMRQGKVESVDVSELLDFLADEAGLKIIVQEEK